MIELKTVSFILKTNYIQKKSKKLEFIKAIFFILQTKKKLNVFLRLFHGPY